MTPIIRPGAQADLKEAYWWYEDKRVGLGEEFLSCAREAIAVMSAGFSRIFIASKTMLLLDEGRSGFP